MALDYTNNHDFTMYIGFKITFVTTLHTVSISLGNITTSIVVIGNWYTDKHSIHKLCKNVYEVKKFGNEQSCWLRMLLRIFN